MRLIKNTLFKKNLFMSVYCHYLVGVNKLFPEPAGVISQQLIQTIKL